MKPLKLFIILLALIVLISSCTIENVDIGKTPQSDTDTEVDENVNNTEEKNNDEKENDTKMTVDIIKEDYASQAEWSEEMLIKYYWNEKAKFMNNTYPFKSDKGHLNYWWKAHAVDAMMDGFDRTGESRYTDKAEQIVKGIISRNGSLYNEFYDDMQWLALSALRLYDATGDETIKGYVLNLWGDIKNAWWEDGLGGMAWKKDNNNRNTCSNGPASILAARLYERFGNEEDLEFAKKIHAWLNKNLVDLETGIVWDGLAVNDDGSIDTQKNWILTYGQGTYIGSAVELYKITNDEKYLKDAEKTTAATLDKLVNYSSGILREEGQGDGGLFKGILIRYLVNLYEINGDEAIKEMIYHNADSLVGVSYYDGLFGPKWDQPRLTPLDLSTELSGVFLFEGAAKIEKMDLK